MRTLWLVVGVLPYVTLAAFDAWLHERSREVPRTEKWLHAGLGLSLIVFIGAAFRSEALLALAALVVFVPVAAADELGFHGHLAARERRIHFASYAALGLFVLVWLMQGSRQ
jgi:hypothetical protein